MDIYCRGGRRLFADFVHALLVSFIMSRVDHSRLRSFSVLRESPAAPRASVTVMKRGTKILFQNAPEASLRSFRDS